MTPNQEANKLSNTVGKDKNEKQDWALTFSTIAIISKINQREDKLKWDKDKKDKIVTYLLVGQPIELGSCGQKGSCAKELKSETPL